MIHITRTSGVLVLNISGGKLSGLVSGNRLEGNNKNKLKNEDDHKNEDNLKN